jgi:hypothetical protein
MTGSALFGNLARVAKLLALLLFQLPWETVSCSPQGFSEIVGNEAGLGAPPPGTMSGGRECTLISASGLQLAIGTASPSSECVGGMPMNAPDAQNSNNNNNNPFNSANIAVIAAAGLSLLALMARFVLKGAIRAVVGAGGSLLAAGAIVYAVMIQAPEAVRASFAQGGAGPGGSGEFSAAQLERMIHTAPAIGFWLVVMVLVAAIVLNLLAMKTPGPAPAVAAAAPAPPPPAEPPTGV